MERILAALRKTDRAEIEPQRDFGLDPLRAVYSQE
jgi:hypothetical protein